MKESRDAKKERLKFEAEQLTELAKAVDLALEMRAAWYAHSHPKASTSKEELDAWMERSKRLEQAYRNEQNGVLLVACRLTGRSFT